MTKIVTLIVNIILQSIVFLLNLVIGYFFIAMNILSVSNQIVMIKDNPIVIIPVFLLLSYPLFFITSFIASWVAFSFKRFVLTLFLSLFSLFHFALLILSYALIYK